MKTPILLLLVIVIIVVICQDVLGSFIPCRMKGENPYCTQDSSGLNYDRYYTCGGVTEKDDYESGFSAKKYCVDTVGTMPDDSPCKSLYSYPPGVKLCWPITTYSLVPLSQWGNKTWQQQLTMARSLKAQCDAAPPNGLYQPFIESFIAPLDYEFQNNGLGPGLACCNNWWNREPNAAWCHSLSCWCPRPCTSVQLTSTPAWMPNPDLSYTSSYCFSDCRSCDNLRYGARSQAACSVGSVNEGMYNIANENDCSCCRMYNSTTTTTDLEIQASRTSSPSLSRSSAMSKSQSLKPTGSASLSRSKLPSTTRSHSLTPAPSASSSKKILPSKVLSKTPVPSKSATVSSKSPAPTRTPTVKVG